MTTKQQPTEKSETTTAVATRAATPARQVRGLAIRTGLRAGRGIVWTWTDGGIMAEDDWEAPVV